MSLAAEERVCSFIDIPVIVLEDFPSEIPIDVAHHPHEQVDLFVKRIDAIAAGRRRHYGSRRGVMVFFLVVADRFGSELGGRRRMFVIVWQGLFRLLESAIRPQSAMAAGTQQQISVTDLDVPQLADVRRQLDEVRLPPVQITLVATDWDRRS